MDCLFALHRFIASALTLRRILIAECASATDSESASVRRVFRKPQVLVRRESIPTQTPDTAYAVCIGSEYSQKQEFFFCAHQGRPPMDICYANAGFEVKSHSRYASFGTLTPITPCLVDFASSKQLLVVLTRSPKASALPVATKTLSS